MFRRLLPVLLTVLLFFTGVQAAYAYDTPAEGAAVLEELLETLEKHHLEKPRVDVMVEGAIQGMVEAVGDPYTSYLSPRELNELTSAMNGNLEGEGMELYPGEPYPTVSRGTGSSPAENPGTSSGEEITAGEGNKNTSLDGGETAVPTVDCRMLDGSTGYICIAFFNAHTREEFRQSLQHLLDRGMTSLVLDLRNNHGGYMQAALDIASDFLPAGKLICKAVDREGNSKKFHATGSRKVPSMPVAILVNEYSASAAEMLASALRDHGEAFLVGTRTFGKGVLQTVEPLENGGAVKITTHRYFTPSGDLLDENGLKPERVVKLYGLQLAVAYQELKDSAPRVEYDSEEGSIKVNGMDIDYPCLPQQQGGEGKVYVPLRCTLEAVGYRVDNSGLTIKISGNGKCMEVFSGSNIVRLNKKSKVMSGTAVKKYHRDLAYISLEALQVLNLELRTNPEKLAFSGPYLVKVRQEKMQQRGIV